MTFLTGCSGFHPANYEVGPTGRILVLDQKGNPIREKELLGKKAKVWITTNEVHQGDITDVTLDTITLKISWAPSSPGGVKTIFLTLEKTEITQMEIEWEDQGASTVVVLTGVALAAIFAKYIFTFLWLLAGGGSGMN